MSDAVEADDPADDDPADDASRAVTARQAGRAPSERVVKKRNGEDDEIRRGTRVRRWTAAVLALAVVMFWIASRYSHDLDVCRRVADDFGVHTVCNPPGLGDFVPVLLLFAALIWPDITELDISGLGKIVKRLDHTNERQDQIAETQDRIVHQLTDVRQVAKQRVEVNFVDTAVFRRLGDLEEAMKALQAGKSPALRVPHFEPDPESARSALLQSWPKLEPWAEFGRRLSDDEFEGWARAVLEGGDATTVPGTARRLIERVRSAAGQPVDVDEVRSWYAGCRPELEIVRRALNNLGALDGPTLDDAAVLAERSFADLTSRGLIRADQQPA